MRLIFMCLTLLLVLGCAEKKYAQTSGFGGGQEKAGTCPASFSAGLCISMKWERVPTESEFGAFLFQTYRLNPQDNSVSLEDPQDAPAVVLWMPSMGHGSSPVTVERVAAGTYRASQVFFTMRGDWEIRFQLKDKNGVRDQAVIPLIF